MTTLPVTVPISFRGAGIMEKILMDFLREERTVFVRRECLVNLGEAHNLLVVNEARVWDSGRKRTQDLCTQNKEASTRGRQGV